MLHQETNADRHLARLRDIAGSVNATNDMDVVFESIVSAICSAPPWMHSGIMAINRNSGFSELVCRYDPHAGSAKLSTRWKLSTSPALRVIETRTPLVIEDAQTSEFLDYRKDAIERGYRTVVLLPLGGIDLHGREMVLAVHSRETIVVDTEEINFLTTAAQIAGTAIEKAKFLNSERQVANQLRNALDTEATLIERVLGGTTTEVAVSVVSAMLPHPVVIFDFIDDRIYPGRSPEPDKLTDQEWTEAVNGPLGQSMTKMVWDVKLSDCGQSQSLNIARSGTQLKRDVIVEPLRIDDLIVGALVLLPREKRLSDFDVLKAQSAKFALSVQLMRRHVEVKAETNDHSLLFDRLTDETLAEPRQIVQRAQRLGVDINRKTRLAAVRLREASQDGEARSLQGSIYNILRKSSQRSFVVEQNNIVFFGLPEDEETANRLVAQVEATVRWQTDDNYIIAIGPVCCDVNDYRPARDECSQILDLAHGFGRSGVLRFSDFGSYAVLLSAIEPSTLCEFVDNSIGRIDAYDRSNGTRLMETAVTYIELACRLSATAEKLGIHVSTLRYRLSRLNEVFGIDLVDDETRFRLSLAVRLRSLRSQPQMHRI